MNEIPPEQFGDRLYNKRTNGQWMYHCSTCEKVNNPFLTPDDRVVCVICRLKELGIDPAAALDEHRKNQLQPRNYHEVHGDDEQ
jgi:hypothetical protein